MELANWRAATIRQARQADLRMLSDLMKEATYRHHHADWYLPSEWIDSPSFVVLESIEDSQSRLLGCLAATAEVLPAAWLRLAAIRGSDNAPDQLARMLEQVNPYLREKGVVILGWLVNYGWPESIVKEAGFSIANWIVTYDAATAGVEAIVQPQIKIRPVALKDLARLAEIETRAFDPLWRLSLSTLNVAYHQAYSFDVVIVEDVIAGFQLTLLTQESSQAHLVRITVDPAFQQQGLGTALVSNLMRQCDQRGLGRLSLNTQINNIRSIHLYEKFNFQRTGDQIPLYTKQLLEE